MPNGAYAHLLINHIPVLFAPLAALALVVGWVTKRRAVWLYGLATMTLAGISAYPTMLTGHAAEEVVEDKVVGVDRHEIHDHEEAGELATWILLAAGAAAAYGWWRLGKSDRMSLPNDVLPVWLRGVALLLTLAAAGAVTFASLEGGNVVHREAHGGTVGAPNGASDEVPSRVQ